MIAAAAEIRDRFIRLAVELEHRQRREGGFAVVGGRGEVDVVVVEGAGDGGEGGEGGAVGRGAGEGVDEAAAVGHAGGVDAGGVDAVVGLEVGDCVGDEDFVAREGRGVVGSALPAILCCYCALILVGEGLWDLRVLC